MKHRIIGMMTIIAALFALNGCLDEGPYQRSEFTKLDIADLVDISGTGYYIDGSGSMNGGKGGEPVHIRFCKNNRFDAEYGYANSANIRKEGTYKVDLDRNKIIITLDKTDSSGKHLKGVISVGSRYIRQKDRVEIKGLGVYIAKVMWINTAKCDKSDFE